MEKISICGAGGFARETLFLLEQLGLAGRVDGFYESDEIWSPRQVSGNAVLPLSRFDASKGAMVIAIGNPAVRQSVYASLPETTRFPTLVHPSVALSRSVEVGAGSVVCAGVIMTCNIHIGAQVHLDRCVTVGHDSVIEDFVTIAPGAVVSGNCRIEAGAYLGAASSIREKLSIGAGATIGMGAIVVKAVPHGETHVGNPAKKLVKKALLG